MAAPVDNFLWSRTVSVVTGGGCDLSGIEVAVVRAYGFLGCHVWRFIGCLWGVVAGVV